MGSVREKFLLLLFTATVYFAIPYFEEGVEIMARQSVENKLVDYGLGKKSILSQEILKTKKTLHEEFEEYKAKNFTKMQSGIAWLVNDYYYIENYDKNNDNKPDYGEARNFFVNKDGKLDISKYPSKYAFDLNGNNIFEPCEIFLDEKRNGVSGDEVISPECIPLSIEKLKSKEYKI